MEITKDQLMTSKEICEALKIKQNTLHSRRWRKGVQIPTFRLGKYLLIQRSDFQQWYEQRMIIG